MEVVMGEEKLLLRNKILLKFIYLLILEREREKNREKET